MGFLVRLAPGVHVTSAERGLRAELRFGNAAADASLYPALGGARPSGRRVSTMAYRRQLSVQARQAGQVQRMEHTRALVDSFQHMLNMHRIDFAPASRPAAAAPAQPDRAAIYRKQERLALAGVSRLRPSERRAARAQAAATTEVEVQRQWDRACEERADEQRLLDKRWLRLCANDPDVVLATLEEAFEQNEVPAAAIGVDGPEITLALLVPTVDGCVPTHMPAATRTGLAELTPEDRAGYYRLYASGQILATVREAFAVAPRLHSARIVVLRQEDAGWTSCVLAAVFDRSTLDNVNWDELDAASIVYRGASELVLGYGGDLAPIDVRYEPDLATVLHAVTLDSRPPRSP